MNPYIVIMYFISNFIFTLAIKNIMGVFFEKQRTSFPIMAFSYLLYFVLASFERLTFNGAVSHMLFILPILFIISLNYESSMPKRLVATASNYVLFSVVAVFIAIFVNLLPVFLITYVNDNFIGQYMSASLLSYLVSLLFRSFKNIRKSNISIPLFWVSALFVLVPTIPFVIFHSINLSPIAELTSMFVLLGANLLIFYLYDTLSAAYEDKLQSALYSQENEYYLSQCQLMQVSLEKMKSYRHDIKFHLVALKNYTLDNKAASDYLNRLMDEIDASEVYSDTGNIAFDSIINFKLNHAKEDNIKLDVRLFIPSVLNIEAVDIVTILGNLLDNALDAVTKVEERIVKINIEFRKNNLFIKIDNTFDGRIKYIEEIAEDERRIATRKAGDKHGYGLMNIRKSVEKYNGYVDISHDENIFSVGILLYVDDV